MKVVRKEYDQIVVYVQLKDLGYLLLVNAENIPGLEWEEVMKKEKININDQNVERRDSYIRFSKPEEVAYFRNLPFILNYGNFKDLKIEEIASKHYEIVDKVDGETAWHNDFGWEEKDIERVRNNNYLARSILEFFRYRNSEKLILLPFPGAIENNEKAKIMIRDFAYGAIGK